MTDIRIGILGCGGKMGRMLIEATLTTATLQLVGGADTAAAIVGQDLGTLAGRPPLGIAATSDAAVLAASSDILIDFTVPAASLQHVEIAAAQRKGIVIGTTGLSDSQMAVITGTAEKIPIVWAPNFSLGVNLLLGLVEQAAARLGPDYDIEILEMHHRHKIDAPSGTALGLGRAAAKGRSRDLEALWIKSRDGHTGPRPGGSIGFASLRGGDVVGDHSVIFAADGERLELSHRASDRQIFARGAVRAAAWLAGKSPGFYGMRDVLDLP